MRIFQSNSRKLITCLYRGNLKDVRQSWIFTMLLHDKTNTLDHGKWSVFVSEWFSINSILQTGASVFISVKRTTKNFRKRFCVVKHGNRLREPGNDQIRAEIIQIIKKRRKTFSENLDKKIFSLSENECMNEYTEYTPDPPLAEVREGWRLE